MLANLLVANLVYSKFIRGSEPASGRSFRQARDSESPSDRRVIGSSNQGTVRGGRGRIVAIVDCQGSCCLSCFAVRLELLKIALKKLSTSILKLAYHPNKFLRKSSAFSTYDSSNYHIAGKKHHYFFSKIKPHLFMKRRMEISRSYVTLSSTWGIRCPSNRGTSPMNNAYALRNYGPRYRSGMGVKK